MPQRDEAFIRQAPLADIRTAHDAGELEDLLSDVPEGQVGPGTLRTMKPEAISKAHAEGKLDFLLGRSSK